MAFNVEQFGSNVKLLRKKKGISQEDLARLSGLKLSNFAKLEGGFNSNPTLSTLIAIASSLTSGSIDDLLLGRSRVGKRLVFKTENKQFAKAIKDLRKKKGISQEDLAHKAGLKLSNFAKLEGGFNSNPTLSTLIAIAKSLTDGSIDKLLKGLDR